MVTILAGKRPNPYVGPRAFQPGEKLYGREREAAKLAALLMAERVVLLHSPSGAGKTSLIQAALIPQFRRSEEDGGENFRVLRSIRVNREAPDLSQVNGFNRYVFSAISCLEDELPPSRHRAPEELARLRLADYLKQVTAGDDRDQLLIFDQFEEILTIDPTDWSGHDGFFQEVGAALTDSEQPRWALFSMREEYLGGLDRYVRRVPTHLDITFRLDFLDREAAKRAVQKPSEELEVTFSDAAATELVNDLSMMWTYRTGRGREKQPGPYVEPVQLQVVCHRLWSSLSSGSTQIKEIKPKHLAKFKNVDHALADYYADAVRAVARDTEVSERALRDWFEKDLISEEGIRRQTNRGPEPGGEIVQQALERLEGVYLIRAEQRRETWWYELAHDRLITPIQTNNRDWRNKYLESFQRLAEQWSADQSDMLLLFGTELDEFERWMRDHQQEATTEERRFLDACLKARAQRRRRRLLLRVGAGVAILVLALGLLALKSARDAARQAQLARSRELVAAALGNLNSDPELSILLALKAVEDNPSGDKDLRPEERDILYESVAASRVQARYAPSATGPRVAPSGSASGMSSRTGLVDVALQPGGTTVAFASREGRVELWRSNPPQHLRDLVPREGGTPPAIVRVAYSPDGRRLAAADERGTATVWEVASGRRALTLRQGTRLTSVAYSDDGKLLVTGGGDRQAVIWDARSGRQRAVLPHPEAVAAVAFGHGGLVATASGSRTTGGIVRLWQAESGRQVQQTYRSRAEVSSLAFSPDGRWLAAGCLDGTATIWDVVRNRELQSLSGHTNSVLWIGFAPDGERIATTSADGTARVWDARTGHEQLALRGHAAPVGGAAFTSDSTALITASSDGTGRRWLAASGHSGFVNSVAFPLQRRLATASTDRSVRVWDVATLRQLRVLTGHNGDVRQVVFDRDGGRMATASEDGTARIWDAENGRLLRTLSAGTSLNGLAFNPAGNQLAVAGANGAVSVWDPSSGKRLLGFKAHVGPVNDLAWSPDGSRIATGGNDGWIYLWEATSGTRLLRLARHADRVLSVAFNPAGTLLASGSADQTAVIWDLRHARPDHVLGGHTGAVSDVAFSPDGRQLATASWDKSALTWDVGSGRKQLVLRNSAEVNAVAFSPDGHFLATGSSDKNFHLYPLLEDDLLEAARARLTRGLSPAECQQYLRDACR